MVIPSRWRNRVSEIQIKLAALWVMLMLTYLLGDVLRIFSGDFQKMQTGVMKFTQGIWMIAAVVMLIPIVMIFLSLNLPQPVNRWVNIGAAVFMFLFNIIGLPTYPSMYDKFLIVVGLAMNALTVYYAWGWR